MLTIAMARIAPLDPYVMETLLPDLVGHDRAPSAFLVYLKLWHAAGGPNHNVEISLSSLAVETGLSKSSVQAALRRLAKRGLVTSRRTSPTAVPLYLVHSPWRGR
jgi:DNA-binding transcriptional ArsR family regulator